MEKVVHVKPSQVESLATAPQMPSPVQKVMKTFPKASNKQTMKLSAIALAVVLLGVGTGWVLADRGPVSSSSTPSGAVAPGAKENQKEAGLTDDSTFSDTAEGTLEEGGIDGEGTHHLVRPGGDDQTAYLTSTVINLDNFVGKKVTVWGQTIAGKKAGWLMDVGRVKIIE
jgi:hypothetical protein